MRSSYLRQWAAVVMLIVSATALGAAQAGKSAAAKKPVVSGAELYANYCASCHGRSGKGDGPLATELRDKPTDLTQLAKKNGGTFPAEAIRKEIDGKSLSVRGHGSPDMPIWGDVFTNVRDYTPLQDKLTALTKHIQSLQQK